MSEAAASDPATRTTRDTVFLAVTRTAMIYGVPLKGFLIALGAASFVFDATHAYNVWWRLGLCFLGGLAALGAMQMLTSWEHRWFEILLAWFETRARALPSRSTRAFGGTTFCPYPTAGRLRHDPEAMRDYAGGGG